MAKFTNHKQDFDRITILNKCNSILFWALLTINLLPEVINLLPKIKSEYSQYEQIVNFLNIVFFIFSFIITITTEFVLLPVAEKKRRLDYFENSFSKQFQLKASEKYYTNDEIQPGFYKMAVNLFQNLLFTSTISKKMVLSVVIKGAIFFLIFLLLSFFGLSANKTFIPILQAIFSLNILGHTIKFLIFNQRVINTFNDLKNLFSNDDLKSNIQAHTPQILRIYVDYECTIAWGLISLDESLFGEMNDPIENEWKSIKTKFNIQ